MEKFITLYPFVYVNRCCDDAILYNTISGDSIVFKNNPCVADIVSKLGQQDYACIIQENDINNLTKFDFLRLIVEKNMGYYIDKELYSVLPLSTQSADIDGPMMLASFKKEEYIIENIREITFYVNNDFCNSKYANPATIAAAHKQFLFPIIEQQKNELPLPKIKKAINDLENNSVNINILGGNVLGYSQVEHLIKYLNKGLHNVFYYFHYTDIKIDTFHPILMDINENDTIVVLIDFPFIETHFDRWEAIINKKNVQIEFIVESDLHIQEAEIIISKYNLKNFYFKPFYNGQNLCFFKENVFMSEKDILEVKSSLFELIAKKISNPSFFGKLTVDNMGNIYTDFNNPHIGNIDKIELKKLVYELIKDENSTWLKNRRAIEPCCNCIYNILCPPFSSYENTIKRYNLCEIK